MSEEWAKAWREFDEALIGLGEVLLEEAIEPALNLLERILNFLRRILWWPHE